MKKQLVLILTVSLGLLWTSGCAYVAKTVAFRTKKVKSMFDTPSTEKVVGGLAYVTHIGEGDSRIPVLHLRATNSYARGYLTGKTFPREIAETIENIYEGGEELIESFATKSKSGLTRTAVSLLTDGDKRSIVNSVLDKAWKILEPHVPQEDLDEMQGLVDGIKASGLADVSLRTIHRMHAIPDFFETSCSALVAGKSATTDGNMWQMRILDYMSVFHLERTPLITVYHRGNESERTFVSVGWIGFVGVVTGVNEDGVCFSEMGYGRKPGETLSGVPMPFLLKKIFRYARTAKEGIAIMRAARRTNAYAYLVGDPDGTMAGLLTARERFVEFHVNEHELVEDGEHSLPQFRDVIYAGHRNKEQCESVRRLKGNLNLETIQEMAREIAMKSNLHTVIYNLTTGDLYVANRGGDTRAADCTYVHFPASAWKK